MKWITKYSGFFFGIAVFLFAVLLNLNTFKVFFLGDDFDLVLSMMRIKHWTEYLTYTFWDVQEPLWFFSLGTDQRIWDLNPAGYHIQNIFFNALCGALIYWFVYLLMNRNKWPAAISAMLFLTHPLHDEVVAYISGRPHAITTSLALLTMILYHLFRTKKKWYYLIFTVVTAPLAWSAKEMSFTLPFVISTYELCYHGDYRNKLSTLRNLILYTLPYYLMLGVYIGIRKLIMGGEGDKLGIDSSDTHPVEIIGGILSNFDLGVIAERIPRYLSTLFWPFPFSRFLWSQLGRYWPIGLLLTLAVVMGGVEAMIRWKKEGKTSRTMLFGLAALCVMILPLFHEDLGFRRRYSYYPGAGFVIFAGVFLYRLTAMKSKLKYAGAAVLMAYLIINTGLTIRNNLTYIQSGQIARNMIDDISAVVDRRQREITLFMFGFPRFCGGDDENGAYLFHYTDFRSAMLLFPKVRVHLRYVFKTSYAENFSSEVFFEDYNDAKLIVTFSDRNSFNASYHTKEGEKDSDRFRTLTVKSVDDKFLKVHADIHLHSHYFQKRPQYFFRYEKGHCYPVPYEY